MYHLVNVKSSCLTLNPGNPEEERAGNPKTCSRTLPGRERGVRSREPQSRLLFLSFLLGPTEDHTVPPGSDWVSHISLPCAQPVALLFQADRGVFSPTYDPGCNPPGECWGAQPQIRATMLGAKGQKHQSWQCQGNGSNRQGRFCNHGEGEVLGTGERPMLPTPTAALMPMVKGSASSLRVSCPHVTSIWLESEI